MKKNDSSSDASGLQLIQRAEVLARLLSAQRLMLTTAESCTAGGVAYAVTCVPGASSWFDRGFVTYSNEAKVQTLGVSPVYLRDFGAVSEPVARAMALGALTHSSAQAAVSVTGIAGPEGAEPGKPVGMVCFAWALRRRLAEGVERVPSAGAGISMGIHGGMTQPWVRTVTHRFSGDRAAVRTQSIRAALDGLIELLEQRHDV